MAMNVIDQHIKLQIPTDNITIVLLCDKKSPTTLKIHLKVAIFPFSTLYFMELV